MYRVVIRRQAKKKLLTLAKPVRVRLAEHIQKLGYNPDNQQLDIKKLKGSTGFRLRVGQWRIIFERDDSVKIIAIEKIGARGDVYK